MNVNWVRISVLTTALTPMGHTDVAALPDTAWMLTLSRAMVGTPSGNIFLPYFFGRVCVCVYHL